MREITLQIEEPAYRRLKRAVMLQQATGRHEPCVRLAALIVKAVQTGHPKILIYEEKTPHGEESRKRKPESGEAAGA